MDMLEAINSIGKEPISIDAMMDAGWVNRFNQTLGEQTLNWADSISTPEVNKSGLEDFYSLSDKDGDSLNVEPLRWNITLKETQTTRALVKFMSHSDPSIRLIRVASVLSALHCSSVLPKSEDTIKIASEFIVDGGRIDILVAWGRSDDDAQFKNAVIIEVKQDASLSKGQLKTYETAAPKIADQVQFAFLCKTFSSDDTIQLRASTQKWECSQWWAFLRRMETKIKETADDSEFRKFRSTLWEQLA